MVNSMLANVVSTLLVSLTLVACLGDSATAPDAGTIEPPEHLLLGDTVLNIAHRGGALLAPEETMPAFEAAVLAGVDVLEMDTRSTKDGVIVLLHDAEVDRTTNGSGRISEMTYAEALELDPAYHFSTDGGANFPLRGTGIKIARLRDVLEGFPQMLFSIEIKDSTIDEDVLDIVVDLGLQDRVVIASFNDPTLRRVRNSHPEVLTTLTVAESLTFARLTMADEASYEPPAWILHTPPSFGDVVVDEELTKRADRFGIKIQVWTVNEESEMQSLLNAGVHGIMSDDPITLKRVLDSRM